MTVWESQRYDVQPERVEEFLAVMTDAAEIFRRAEGCRAYELRRSVQVPGRVHLHLEWESVEHHTVTFAATEDRIRLREAITPYLVERGVNDHAEVVLRESFR